MFVFLVGIHRIQIFGFEDLIAIQAADIVDPVPPGKNLGSLMLTGVHKVQDYFLILVAEMPMSSPLTV